MRKSLKIKERWLGNLKDSAIICLHFSIVNRKNIKFFVRYNLNKKINKAKKR